MLTLTDLEQILENVVMVSGESLLSRRHMPVPPNMTAVVRKPQQPALLCEMLREEYPADHPIQLIMF